MSDYGDEVYVCLERNLELKSLKEWIVAGVVVEEEDAKLWLEPDDDNNRRVVEKTIGVVESFHTSHLDPMADTAE